MDNIFNNEKLNIISPSITGEDILSAKEITFNVNEQQELSLIKNRPEIISGYEKTLNEIDKHFKDKSFNQIYATQKIDSVNTDRDITTCFDLLFINIFNHLNNIKEKENIANKLKEIKVIQQFIISNKNLIICFIHNHKELKKRLSNLELLNEGLLNYTFKILEEHII